MKSEVLKIIEGALEGDKEKVIAYANLLVSKSNDDKVFQTAIIDRISGEYKTKPVFKMKGNDPELEKGEEQ